MRAGTGLALAVALALFIARPASAEPLALDVFKASAGFDYRAREPIVSIYLRPASIKAFFDFTKANVGRDVELRIDGKRVTRSSSASRSRAACSRSTATSPATRRGTSPSG